MTPGELWDLSDGSRYRQDRTWDVAAWVVASIANYCGHQKKKVEPSNLLKRKLGETKYRKRGGSGGDSR